MSPHDIRVAVLFDASASRVVDESPLSSGQKLTWQKDGRALVEATVPDTWALRAWLLSFGASAEVLRPATLRREIGDTLRAAAARYDGLPAFPG